MNVVGERQRLAEARREESKVFMSVYESEITAVDDTSQRLWELWTSRNGPPVPVKLDKAVWQTLVAAAKTTEDPIGHPQVFRLFMKRGIPRHVVRESKIEKVRRTERGIIRWEEGGYPGLDELLRKGGNAFVRGDIQLRLDDAWWMGRERTDLRILLVEKSGAISVSAWWARGGARSSKRQLDSAGETNGELWEVKLLISG